MLDDDTLRALLATRTQGDWRQYAMEVCVVGDDDEPGLRVGQADTERAGSVANAELMAAAPSLAAEVLRLRAIIEGRPTPPTTAEVEAHMAAGGAWLASIGARVQILAGRIEPISHTDFTRWVALDRECRPCAWPTPTPDAPRYVTTSRPGAVIEVQEHPLSPEERAALDFGRKPFGGGQ